MKHITDTVNTMEFLARRQSQEDQKKLDSVSVAIVNQLFAIFESICRGFEKQYGQQQRKLNMEKIQWALGFMDSGINRIEQLEFGIKQCRLEGPINTPTLGQFLKWCMPNPEQLGIPSVDIAYKEACRNSKLEMHERKWTHKAVYNAYFMCNYFELINLPEKNTFPIFKRNYEIIVKKMVRGEELKAIPLGVTHDRTSERKGDVKKEYEHCRNHQSAMAAMRDLLGGKNDGTTNQARLQKNA